jgi:hypothetical protein
MPDSITYYFASRSFLTDGSLRNGLSAASSPLTHYPPLFPILLAMVQGVFAPSSAFLFLNSVALIGSTYVLYQIVYMLTEQKALSFLFVCIFLAHPETTSLFRSALTEPLYLFFSLALLYALTRRRDLFAGVWAAAALLTRYAGAHIFLFFALYCFVTQEQGRLRRLLFLISLPLSALLLWLLRNWIVASELTSRRVVHHSESLLDIGRTLGEVVSRDFLFLPESILSSLVGMGVLLFLFLALWRERARTVSLFSLTSLSFVLFSKIFFDAGIPLNGRMLYSPLLFACIAVAGVLAPSVPSFGETRVSRILLPLIGGLLVVLSILLSSPPMATPFEARTWESDPSFVFLHEKEKEGGCVYSNAADFLAFYGGIDARSLPRKVKSGTREHLSNSLPNFQLAHAERGCEGWFVFYDRVGWRWYLWKEQELQKVVPLHLEMQESGVRIYRIESER